jgi:hypothetical protein
MDDEDEIDKEEISKNTQINKEVGKDHSDEESDYSEC